MDLCWDIYGSVLESPLAKHGISFKEASAAFFNPAGIDGPDLEHSTTEDRRFRLVQSPAGNIHRLYA